MQVINCGPMSRDYEVQRMQYKRVHTYTKQSGVEVNKPNSL